MMPSRSALLLLTCMTCLGIARSSVGAQVRRENALMLPMAIALKTATTEPLLIAQAAPATPTPTPRDTLPNLQNQTPAQRTPKRRIQFTWQFWLIVTGIVFAAIAGGLIYWMIRIGKETDAADEAIADEPSEATQEVTQTHSEQQVLLPSPSVLENDNNNGYSHNLPPLVEDKPVEAAAPQPAVEVKSNNSVISPPSENKQSQELTVQTGAEALEVRETTRLAKINIVDELIKELQSPDPTKRRKAIWELAQRGDSRAIQPLVDLMMDADSKQRSLILEALSQISTRTLKPMNRALVLSLQDDNAEVRKNAIRDLTRVYDIMVQASQLLRHAAEDPDSEVRDTARWALGQLNRIRSLGNVEDRPHSGNSSEK